MQSVIERGSPNIMAEPSQPLRESRKLRLGDLAKDMDLSESYMPRGGSTHNEDLYIGVCIWAPYLGKLQETKTVIFLGLGVLYYRYARKEGLNSSRTIIGGGDSGCCEAISSRRLVEAMSSSSFSEVL